MQTALKSRPITHPLTAAFLLLLISAACLAQDAPPVDVTPSVDKQKITIGDLLNYRIEATAAPGTKITIPDAEKRLAPFEVRDYSAKEDTVDGKLHAVFSYQVAIFEVGEKTIGGLELLASVPGAKDPVTVKVPPIKLTVASVLTADAQDLKDIREPVPVKMGSEQWLAAALIALAILLALGALAYIIIRRRRRRGPVVKPEVVIAAHERALKELAALGASGLVESGEAKLYYTRLSEIVREYLEARFGVPAMEETTWMISRDLERKRVDRESREQFVGLLRRADLVKFARHELADSDARADLTDARRAVEASRPAPAAPQQEAEPLPAAAQ